MREFVAGEAGQDLFDLFISAVAKTALCFIESVERTFACVAWHVGMSGVFQ